MAMSRGRLVGILMLWVLSSAILADFALIFIVPSGEDLVVDPTEYTWLQLELGLVKWGGYFRLMEVLAAALIFGASVPLLLGSLRRRQQR